MDTLARYIELMILLPLAIQFVANVEIFLRHVLLVQAVVSKKTVPLAKIFRVILPTENCW